MTTTPSAPPWVELTAAIIAESPPLRDAACRLLPPKMFDADAPPPLRQQAAEVCSGCACLSACRDWVLGSPDNFVSGVVGGMVVEHQFGSGDKRGGRRAG